MIKLSTTSKKNEQNEQKTNKINKTKQKYTTKQQISED